MRDTPFKEGEHINGTGIHTEWSALRRELIIVVTDEELAMNPLARAWAEAFQLAEKQGIRDKEAVMRHFSRLNRYGKVK